MYKLTTTGLLWLVVAAILITLSSAPAFANTITIANPTLSSTEISAAAGEVTVTATVSDSNQSDGPGEIYALWSPNYQGATDTAMTSEGAGGAQSATFDVPVNPLVQRVIWTVTIVADYGKNSLTKQLTFVQDSAGPPVVTLALATAGGAPLTTIDPAGQTIDVTATVDSAIPLGTVSAQLTSPPEKPTTIMLTNDAALGPNVYTGLFDVAPNGLQQSVPWTVTAIAAAGNNVGTDSMTLTQNTATPPTVSNVETALLATPDDNNNNFTVSATVTSEIPVTKVLAYINQNTEQAVLGAASTDGYDDTITLTKSSGNTYTGAAMIGANSSNVAEGWTVRVVAFEGNYQATGMATFSQPANVTPTISDFSIGPSSSEGADGGDVTIGVTIDGLTADAQVTAWLLHSGSPYAAELKPEGNQYTGLVDLPENVGATVDKWSVVIGIVDDTYVYGSPEPSGSFSQAGNGTASPVSPTVSATLEESQYAPAGETAHVAVDTTTMEDFSGGHESRITVVGLANGVPQPGVSAIDDEATDGSFDEAIAIPQNSTGIPLTWTFRVTVEDALENTDITTTGTATQAYATPAITDAVLAPAQFAADGVNTTTTVNVTADDAFNLGNVLFYANGAPAGSVELAETSSVNDMVATDAYKAVFGIAGNQSGAPITWTAQIVDTVDGVGASTVNLGPVVQPFVLSLADATVTPTNGANGTLANSGDTARFTATANADGDLVVEVDAYANGIYQSNAILVNTAGDFNANGAYNGTLAIPGNVSGVDQNWTFVFTVVDGGGNFATTTVGPIKQPYVYPTLVGAAVVPGNVIPNAGVNAALSVTATSADGVNNITAYAFASGIFRGQVQLGNAGANQPNGLFNGVFPIPALAGEPVVWTFVIVDVDSGGNVTFTSVNPVSQGPAITALAPNTAKAVTAINPLTVTGANFDNTCIVDWNGIPLATTFVNAGTLTAVVPKTINGLLPGDTYPGNVPITVTTGTGFVTPPAQFQVTEPVPTVASLLPSQAFVTGNGFTMTVTGTNFGTGSTVVWTPGLPALPTNLATTFVSNTTLTAVVPASLIGTIGFVSVSVVQAGGTPSAAPPQLFDIIIKPLAPKITTLAPVDGAIGSTVTITGTNFSGAGFTTSGVSFNGVAAKFTVTSATSITVTVPTGATTGPVTVTTPGGTSNAVTFTVTNGHAFSSGLAMISVPSDYTGQSLAAVLGYTSPKLAVWDSTVSTYDVTPDGLAAALQVGHGYWVRFPAAETITTLGTPTPTTGPLVITLSQGWNMIGDPFPSDVPISGIQVTAAGSTSQSFAAAVSSGLVSGSLFTYQAADTAYETIASASGSLVPYEGYWVFVASPCTLSIPPP